MTLADVLALPAWEVALWRGYLARHPSAARLARDVLAGIGGQDADREGDGETPEQRTARRMAAVAAAVDADD